MSKASKVTKSPRTSERSGGITQQNTGKASVENAGKGKGKPAGDSPVKGTSDSIETEVRTPGEKSGKTEKAQKTKIAKPTIVAGSPTGPQNRNNGTVRVRVCGLDVDPEDEIIAELDRLMREGETVELLMQQLTSLSGEGMERVMNELSSLSLDRIDMQTELPSRVTIKTDHECPKCSYKWSGRTR